MYAYRTPGAYFEWRDSAPAIAARRTDIAGFVGIAARGPLHEPVKVQSWTQFRSHFGSALPQAYLAYAVEGFFANGGRSCWVVRVADPLNAKQAKIDLPDDYAAPCLRLIAESPGVWAHELIVTVLRSAVARFSLILRHAQGGQEIWSNLSMDPTDRRYAVSLINDNDTGSRWVVAEDRRDDPQPPHRVPNAKAEVLKGGSARLDGGADGLAGLTPAHIMGQSGAPAEACIGLACLERVDEVSILAVPDMMNKVRIIPEYKPIPPNCRVLEETDVVLNTPPPEPEFPPWFTEEQVVSMQAAVVRQCETLKDRVAVLDTPLGSTSRDQVLAWRQGFDTSYAALYFPWLGVPDPLVLSGVLRTVPPSGHVAGVYARGDLQVGVHKPPANQVVDNAKSLAIDVDDALHGMFNDEHVNIIRAYSGRGLRVSGARTLSSDSEYRYINVRRLLAMIAEAIDERAQSLVFEPNNAILWEQIERLVLAYLDRLWRAGALDGATAQEAYSVRCDAQTNPAAERDAGRAICEIGVNPPWPAEFVVVRIGFTQAGAQLLDGEA